MDILTKRVKASLVQKCTSLCCNAAFKPGKDNTYAISQ